MFDNDSKFCPDASRNYFSYKIDYYFHNNIFYL